MQVWGPLFVGAEGGGGEGLFIFLYPFSCCVGYLALCDGNFFLQGVSLAHLVICAAGEGEVALHSLA